MRTFQLLNLILFVLFYAFISFASIKSIIGIVPSPFKRKIQWATIIVSVLIILSFILLYVWPLNARSTENYTIHLIYNSILSFDFVFKIPLALSFIFGAFLKNTKKKILYISAFIISIGIGSNIIYGTLFGRKELVVNNVELEFENLPKVFEGYKIIQISDIHLGSFLGTKKQLKKVITETNKINPEIVLFTGDLVNNFSSELKGWKEIFEEITVNRKSYSILGNHDYGNYSKWENQERKTDNFKRIISAHKDFGFTILNNESIKIKSNTDSIFILGVENWGHPPFPQYANLEKALIGIPENSFTILLSHDPAHWESVVKENASIDLTLSGHTHGLQWGIKKAGITFSLSYFVRKNWAGIYEYKNSKLYVNSGLGTVGIPWRINMPGEITVITLKRIEID